MSNASIQTEPAETKSLMLKDAGMMLENIEVKIDELSSMICTVAHTEDIDLEICSALRGIGKFAAQIGCQLWSR